MLAAAKKDSEVTADIRNEPPSPRHHMTLRTIRRTHILAESDSSTDTKEKNQNRKSEISLGASGVKKTHGVV